MHITTNPATCRLCHGILPNQNFVWASSEPARMCDCDKVRPSNNMKEGKQFKIYQVRFKYTKIHSFAAETPEMAKQLGRIAADDEFKAGDYETVECIEVL